MNNDAILASISKIHAYRYAKEKQRGAKFGENQVTTTATKFTTAPIQIGTEDFSVEFYGNSYGSDAYSGYSFIRYANGTTTNKNAFNILASKATNGISVVQFGNLNLSSLNYSNPDNDGLFHMIITRSGTNVVLYIDGSKFKEFTTDTIGDFGNMDFLISNSRNIALFRVWNYALSADEITTLYNNGNPLGYVVPKVMKDIYHSIEITGNNSNTWTGTEDPTYSFQINVNPEMKDGHAYLVNVSISNYESGTPLIWGGTSQVALPKENGNFNILIRPTSGYTKFILIYGGYAGTDRRSTITVNSVTPVGCIAEYVAPNLIATKKGPQIEPRAESFEFNVGDEYYRGVVIQQKYPYDCIYRVDYIIDEWDYQPQAYGTVGFLGIGGATTIGGASSWNTLEKAKVGETQSYFIKMPGTGSPGLYIYGGNDNEEATARHLKVTIKSITPVSVASTWLDSAKQLPWSDKYLPPLLQSKGGYDMVANGAPEVLYHGETKVSILLTSGKTINSNVLSPGKYTSDDILGFVVTDKGINVLVHPGDPIQCYFSDGQKAVENYDYKYKDLVNVALNDLEGESNTAIIRQSLTYGEWAVQRAYNAEWSDGRHGWLPSLGELKIINDHLDELNSARTKCGCSKLSDVEYYSSTLDKTDENGILKWTFGSDLHGYFDGFNVQGFYYVIPVSRI